MKDRIIWADTLRVFAIFLVILVHVIGLPNQVSDPQSLYPIGLFILAKTGVPLFFMLSGFLLLPKDEPVALFFKKRFLRIFNPYIFWVFVFILFLIFFVQPQSFGELFLLAKTGMRVFWFIPIVFVLYILTPSLRTFFRYANKTQTLIPIVMWYLLVLFLPFVRNTAAFPLQSTSDILTQILIFSGYYVLGFLILKYSLIKSLSISLIIILIGFFWTLFGVVNIFSETGVINTNYLNYFSPSLAILSIGIFSLFAKLDKKFIKINKTIKKIIVSTSTLVFGVYILHTLNVQIFERIGLSIVFDYFPLAINALLNAVILFVATSTVVYLLSKIPKIGKYIY